MDLNAKSPERGSRRLPVAEDPIAASLDSACQSSGLGSAYK